MRVARVDCYIVYVVRECEDPSVRLRVRAFAKKETERELQGRMVTRMEKCRGG